MDKDKSKDAKDVAYDKEKANILHVKTLKETKCAMNHVIVCAFFRGLSIYIFENIWVLYARNFENNTSTIAIIMYCHYIIFAISSLILSTLSDLCGYDIMMFVIYACGTIGLLFQVFANYFDSFIILSFGYLTTTCLPGKSICLAFIAWILPLYSSKQYTAHLYQISISMYVIAPIFSGIISHFWSYHGVFIVALTASIILVIYSFIFVFSKQKYLENIQLNNLLDYYQNIQDIEDVDNVDNVADVADVANVEDSKDSEDTENDIVDNNNNWILSKDFRFPILNEKLTKEISFIDSLKKWDYISKYEWFLLFNILFQNCMGMGMECAIVVYYTVYMEDYYNCSILLSTTQLACVCLGIVLGTQFIKLLSKIRNIPNNFHNNKLEYNIFNINIIIMIISYIFIFCINFIWYSYIAIIIYYNNIYIGKILYFIFAFIDGLFIGFLIMTSEIILLEIQPKQISGRIVGIRGFFRAAAEGTIILAIGLLWDYDENYLWFIQGISCSFGLILLTIMVIADTKYSTKKYNYQIIN